MLFGHARDCLGFPQPFYPQKDMTRPPGQVFFWGRVSASMTRFCLDDTSESLKLS